MPIAGQKTQVKTTYARKRSILRITLLILPLCGLWLIASGGYIHAKAILAQFLLETAWSDTLKGQEEVKPWPWADTWPVARLSVPRLGINRIVLAGANGSSLAFGPGHLFNSSLDEQWGNTLIAGHRDTHFRFLRKLRKGDRIELQTRDNGSVKFRVEKTMIVNKDDSSHLYLDGPQRLTLITCYPFVSDDAGGPLRYLVLARPLLQQA